MRPLYVCCFIFNSFYYRELMLVHAAAPWKQIPTHLSPDKELSSKNLSMFLKMS